MARYGGRDKLDCHSKRRRARLARRLSNLAVAAVVMVAVVVGGGTGEGHGAVIVRVVGSGAASVVAVARVTVR